jgi:hypothetical protein
MSPGSEGDADRPWWDKALDVLRHEEAAFKLVLWTLAIAVVVVGLALVLRAIV